MQFEIKDYKLQGKQANKCLPGDWVEKKEDQYILIERKDHRHRQIPGILEFNSKYIYGHTSRGHKIYLFHPLNVAYPPFRVGCSQHNVSQNHLALIDFASWDDSETLPRGNLVRILGPCGDAKAEYEALLFQYGQPRKAKAVFEVDRPDAAGRKLIEGITFNIDPEGCKDIDDVFTIHRLNESTIQFIITIADVSAYIEPLSIGDKHAYELGQTLYQNGYAAVPMFPPLFSEILFSLLPDEQRLGLSLYCVWDEQSQTLRIEGFQETVVKNNKTRTYDDIQKLKEFSVLKDIASYLKGSLSEDSHEWVEQCMLLYNKEVAKVILAHKVGLLRSHSPAATEKIQRYEAIHPDLRFLAFSSAKYQLTNDGLVHASLGNVPYTHATSPIRRYADIIAQRSLKYCLGMGKICILEEDLPEHLNKIQKQHKQYEKNLFFLSKVLHQKTGILEGIVLDYTEAKCSVYIPEWKRIIKVYDTKESFESGQNIQVEFYADLQKPNWQERIVYNLKR